MTGKTLPLGTRNDSGTIDLCLSRPVLEKQAGLPVMLLEESNVS